MTNNDYNWAINDKIMRFMPSCTLFYVLYLYTGIRAKVHFFGYCDDRSAGGVLSFRNLSQNY